MVRQGLNATLTYQRGSTRRAYKIRCNGVMHGTKIIYDESQARTHKAFYPHRLSSAQFAISLQLNGEAEYKSFSAWMASWAAYVLDLNLAFGEFPSIAVSVPSRNFIRKGIPLAGGFTWGDHVGAMLWEPQIVFETSEEPVDANKVVAVSRFEGLVAQADRDVRYFYPLSQQLSGNAAPPDGAYTTVLTAEDLAAALGSTTDSGPGLQGRDD